MADTNDPSAFDPSAFDDAGADHAAVMVEARDLIDAALDGRASPEGDRRLQQLVIDVPSVTQLYIASVHQDVRMSRLLRRPAMSMDADAPAADGRSSLHDAMVLDAIRPVEPRSVHLGDAGPELAEGSVPVYPPMPPLPRPMPLTPKPKQAVKPAGAWGYRRAMAAAAVLALAAGATWVLWPSAPPAVLTATAVITRSSQPLTPGMRVPLHQAIKLDAGAIVLTLGRGAVVTVTAPAEFRVTDRDTVALDSGSLTASVPVPAHGFTVNLPGLSVIDRGTNFGARVDAGRGIAEVDVFEGRVDAISVDDAGKPTAAPVAVTADHAVAHYTSSSLPPVPVPYAPERFVRDLKTARMVLPWHGTGVGLVPGSPDPAWQVASVPDDPGWETRPAYVVQGADAKYSHDEELAESKGEDGSSTPGADAERGHDAEGAAWVSLKPHMETVVAGDFDFRTTVDLTGFDPATAVVHARIAADDGIADIRVNGVSTGVHCLEAGHAVLRTKVLSLEHAAWRQGSNQVDVIVHNTAAPKGKEAGNFMAVRLGWAAEASPLILR